MGAQLRPPHRVRPEVDAARSRAFAGRIVEALEERPQVDLPPAQEPALVRRTAPDRARRGVDDAVPHAVGQVGRGQGRQVLERARRPDGHRPAQVPVGRDGVALDLHPPGARLEEGRDEEVGPVLPAPPAGGIRPVQGHQVEPQRHHSVGAKPPLLGHQHRSRARAHDLLRRQQRRGHGPRAEPAGRDAERHAGRAGREAARAHERGARLPLAGHRPRVLGLQPRPARDVARARRRRAGPRDPQGAGLGDRPPQARAGSAPGLRSTRQHAALAQLRALHARPLEGSRARLRLRPGAREAHPRRRGLEARARRRAQQGGRARLVRARLRRSTRARSGR